MSIDKVLVGSKELDAPSDNWNNMAACDEKAALDINAQQEITVS
jgi:hypothetical protein